MTRARAALAAALCLAAAAVEAATVTAEQRFGAWTYSKRVDKLDDKVGYIAHVNSKSEDAILAFRCDRIGAGIYPGIYTGRRLGGADETPGTARHRVDKSPAVIWAWFYGPNYAHHFSSSGARELADAIAAGKEFVIRLMPAEGVRYDYEFDLTGAAAAIARLREDCDIRNDPMFKGQAIE